MGRPVNSRYFVNQQAGQTFYNDRIGIARYKRKGTSTSVGTAASARIKDQLSENVFTIEMTAGANPWTEVMELTDEFVRASTDTDDIGKFNIDARIGTLGGPARVKKLEQHQATILVSSGVYQTITWPKTRAEAGISTISSWSIVSRAISVQVTGEFFHKVGDNIRFFGTGNSTLDGGGVFQISSLRENDNTFVINSGSPISDDASSNTGRAPGSALKTGTDHIDLRE